MPFWIRHPWYGLRVTWHKFRHGHYPSTLTAALDDWACIRCHPEITPWYRGPSEALYWD